MSDICSGHPIDDANRPANHASVARGAAGWLAFAAAPLFAIMALLTQAHGNDALCTTMPGASPLTGMPTMYALMSVFHLTPWLALISRRSGDRPRRCNAFSARCLFSRLAELKRLCLSVRE